MPAPTPFFLSYADLRGALRLTSVPDGTDAELQLQWAVRESWTTLWRELTAERITALQAIAHTEPPTTNDHHLRLLAEITEINVVRRHLFSYFASAFNESRTPIQEWNTEGLLRGVSQYNIGQHIAALDRDIAEAVEVLKGKETIGAETKVAVAVPTADTVETDGPITLGESTFGAGGIFRQGVFQ